MIKTNCSKCDGELILHEGYGVCSKCGEIIGFDVEEELDVEIMTKEEVIPEEVEEEMLEETTEIADEAEEIFDEESEEIQADVEAEDTIEGPEEKEETIINEDVKTPKNKKVPVVILIIVVLCILALLGGYFITKVNRGVVDNEAENVTQEDMIEEAKTTGEEPEEINIQQEIENEEVIPEPKSEPVKQDTPKKETVKKEDAVVLPTPSISYRIRKSADDSNTQIGAFSDFERAKAFALSHAADGYKVYDMDGQLVFEP